MFSTCAKDRPFKITWRVEDFKMWTGHSEDVQGSWTPTLAIETLANTEWQFKLSPWTEEEFVACTFQRAVNTDVHDEVNIHYTFYALGHDGSHNFQVSGTIKNLNPGDSDIVDIIPADDVGIVKCPNNLFNVICEIRPALPSEPVDFCRSKWSDELRGLSNDMLKLFETGYLSDLKLVSDDGRRIAVHSFVLLARWPKLCDSLSENGFTNRIAVHGVSGSALYGFVSYLYSGTLHRSCATAELFDFVAENAPWMRKLFHSLATDVCIRTQQRKEELTFTWYADDLREDRMPFFRALPLQQVDGEELVVVLDVQEDEDVGERCLHVMFSLSNLTAESYFTFTCTANLFVGDVSVKSHSEWHSFHSNQEWHFPNFIPMRLLENGTKERRTCPRVQFELVISDMPRPSVVEGWVTEFRTGSRGIGNVEQLTSDFKHYFVLQPRIPYDVILRTKDGFFYSCRAVLSVRSRTFLCFFRNRKKGKMTVDVAEIDSVALGSILEYVYTGWTKLSTLEEVRKMLFIAKRLRLFGLEAKCQQFIGRHPSQPILQTSVVS